MRTHLPFSHEFGVTLVSTRWMLIMLTIFLYAACSYSSPLNTGLIEATQRLNALKGNNRKSSMASLNSSRPMQQFEHLLWMAEHKIELSDTRSRTRYLEYEHTSLLDQLHSLLGKNP